MSSTCRADAESERHQSNRQDEIDSASATRRSRPHVALEHTALALLPLLPLLPPHPCSRGAILRATPARRVSDARAEVVRDAAAALLQPEQGGGVPLGQVDLRDVSRTRRAHAPPAARRCLGRAYHVDVVPHAGAIGGGPVAPEHLKLCSAANGHLTHKRKKVVGDAARVFTDAATGMSTNWIEIAQTSNPPTGLTGCEV